MGDVHDAPDMASGLDLGSLPSLAGYCLRRAQMRVFADFHQVFAPLGLRPAQFSVLLVLRQNPGARASRVADALGIQRANFAPMLAALQAAGTVERRVDPGDRRAATLHLTGSGAALLRRADRAIVAHEDRWRQLLGEADYRTLLDLLNRIAP